MNLEFFYSKEFLAFLIFVVLVIIVRLLFYKLVFIFNKLVSKTQSNLDDLVFEKTKNPLFYLTISWLALFELKFLGLNNNYYLILSNALKSLIIFLLSILIYRVINIFIDEWYKKEARKSKLQKELLHLIVFLKSLVKLTVLTIAIFQILSIWNINITPLLASAGIAGLAVALAAQQILSNFFGGLNLFLDKTLKVGDRVRYNGKYLIVEEVGVRTTKFRTLENTFYIVPNSKLASSEIENISEPQEPKNVRIKIGVAYGSDVEKVKRILKEVAEKNKYRMKGSEVNVYFYELGDYSLNFLVVFKVKKAEDMWPAQVEYIEEVYKRLNEEGIEIPFPTQTIYCKK